MKPPLKVGDRVAVYGSSQVGDESYDGAFGSATLVSVPVRRSRRGKNEM